MALDDSIYGSVVAPDAAFLAKALPEEVHSPAQPLIDAHMHLWRLWPEQPYLVDAFQKEVAEAGHSIAKTVFIECHSHYDTTGPAHLAVVGESRFAEKSAREAPTDIEIAAAIVGFADLLDHAHLREVLDAHEEASAGRFRGIRQRAKWDPDPVVTGSWGAKGAGLYLEPAFHASVKELGRRGLSFDASVYHPQIPEVTALARACPQTQILLNHTGSPVGHNSYRGSEAENLSRFAADMQALSSCPNVAIKLGGMLMNLANYDFRIAPRPVTSDELLALWQPHLCICLDAFGAERCMASSNFPVDKAGFTYRTLWNMFKKLLAGASDHERVAVLHDTAARLYRI